MKKYYVTQSCKKFTPILNIFYKNLKLLDFFDGLVVYTDDNKFSPSDSFIKVIHGKDISYSDNLKIAVKSCSEDYRQQLRDFLKDAKGLVDKVFRKYRIDIRDKKTPEGILFKVYFYVTIISSIS